MRLTPHASLHTPHSSPRRTSPSARGLACGNLTLPASLTAERRRQTHIGQSHVPCERERHAEFQGRGVLVRTEARTAEGRGGEAKPSTEHVRCSTPLRAFSFLCHFSGEATGRRLRRRRAQGTQAQRACDSVCSARVACGGGAPLASSGCPRSQSGTTRLRTSGYRSRPCRRRSPDRTRSTAARAPPA